MRYKAFLQKILSSPNDGIDAYGQTAAGNCHRCVTLGMLCRAGVLLIAIVQASAAFGHGGVVMEEDQCVIDIGLFRAHFTIYQPETSASEEFCEDVPDLGDTIFVMDYLHDSLRQMPVDFRVVRDVNNRREYAAWEDIESVDDLESITVYYQREQVEPGGSLSARYEFADKGWYIGIVTTKQAHSDKVYRAVFGFHVGGQGFGYWPWLVLAVLLVQLQYWISGGGWKRWRTRRNPSSTDAGSTG